MITALSLSNADRQILEEYDATRHRLSSDGILSLAEQANDPQLKAELEEAAHWQFKREEAVEFDYDYD